ncbi:unnamed protein product [Rotaria magnacalcarata]|uniref:Uncharacterized protein n=2 Tax=Rotaria magnacalcarata TaxID=392030 RepID=A0A820E4E0_9BILA|nr:unnamed protein product [Rotaria magnacalcarata]CAF4054563.1 unnamed protein product [Rotaria magnacalcarata]CAF4093117.1 unnamed protein product [Rotaria magnacalcarata]CAF4240819.1 unnamed protein product [Rotaria magnacalcarata]
MGNRAYVPKMNVATQTSPTNVVRGNSPQYNRDERFMVGEEMHRQRPHPIKVLHPDAEDYILSEIPIAPIDVSSLKRIAENPNIGVNPDRDERFILREENMFQASLDEVSDHVQRSVKVSTKKVEALGIEQLRTLNLQVYSTAGKIDEQEGCKNIPNRQIFRQQIQQKKPQQQIKRVVYVDNRILK